MKNMMKNRFFSLWALLLVAVQVAAEATVISVNSFGLKPNSRVNATPYVKEALEACRNHPEAILTFEKGRYDFWEAHATERDYFESNTYDNNPKILAILLDEMQGVTLDGQGSEFIMHGRMQPITLHRCKAITLRNFSIDWDIPLTAQGRVINSSSTYMDLEIDTDQYPYIIENDLLTFVGEGWKSTVWSMMQFTPDTHLVCPNTGDNLGWKRYDAKELKKGVVRLSEMSGKEPFPAPGTLVVLRHNSRDHAGIFLFHSEEVKMEHINVHHTGGLGILSQYCRDISFLDVNMIPNAVKNRVLSGHDDGFHVMGCSGKVMIDSCRFAGLMDDPINIHGTCSRIVKVLSPTRLQCRFMQDMSAGMEWGRTGETVGFIETKTMRTIDQGVITGYEQVNKEEFILEFSGPVPTAIQEGYVVENLSCTPDAEIRNCHFGSCRARGVLVSTPGKVVIEDNVFESSGSAILIAGDANYWFESGAVKDVTIRGNEFRYPCNSSSYQFCEAIISIYPEIPAPDVRYPFHRNIRIEGNTFHLFDYPILYARSVDGLTFLDNKLIRNTTYQPAHRRKEGITLEYCRNVRIGRNQVEGEVLGSKVKLDHTARGSVKFVKNNFFKLVK